MNSRIQLLVPSIAIALTISLAAAFGQSSGQPVGSIPNPPGYGTGGTPNPPGYFPPAMNPQSGLPMNMSGAPQMIDPATGLPVNPPGPDQTTGMPPDFLWKAGNWKDPNKKLGQVNWDGLPISEVARILTDSFTNAFDVLLPRGWTPAPWRSQSGEAMEIPDWVSTTVTLQMRNVTASEIFAAMNLVFENNNTPLRWELKVNGNRQIALLRVRDDLMPQAPPGPKRLQQVFFVGELIGDPKSGGMSMEQIVQTVSDIWKMTDNSGGTIQFHSGAQLLVVNGTPEQVHLIDQTLSALRRKVDLARRAQSMPSEPPPAPSESKSGAPGNLR